MPVEHTTVFSRVRDEAGNYQALDQGTFPPCKSII
jgi:hypothetical protein